MGYIFDASQEYHEDERKSLLTDSSRQQVFSTFASPQEIASKSSEVIVQVSTVSGSTINGAFASNGLKTVTSHSISKSSTITTSE